MRLLRWQHSSSRSRNLPFLKEPIGIEQSATFGQRDGPRGGPVVLDSLHQNVVTLELDPSVVIYTLIMRPIAVVHARGHRVKAHRNSMIGPFLGALVVAGVFTLVPGRVMHDVVFGGN
jgi:hypothetical protein